MFTRKQLILLPNICRVVVTRCCSVHDSAGVRPPGKVKKYAVKKYISYLDRFGDRFEKKYPKVYKVYRLIKDGIRDFFQDTKVYYRVATDVWSGRSLGTFSREELENYRQVPKDMIKIAPVLILSSAPFANYVVFPIAYLLPRQLLCRHFWTPQQTLEYNQFYLRGRLHHYTHILYYMENHLGQIADVGKRKLFSDILWKLEDGQHASVEELLDCKDLFTGKPFGFTYLSMIHKIHMWHVAKSLNMSTRRSKLVQEAFLLHHIDLATHREGVDTLNLDQLQQACFVRGLNAVDTDPNDLKQYLKDWNTISQLAGGSTRTLSLLLHSPLMLTYNRPSNKKFFIKSLDIEKDD